MSVYTYSDIITALGDLLEVQITAPASATPSNDTNFNNIIKSIINDAELRIYRELDFITARLIDTTATTTVNSKTVTLPSEIIVVESLALINAGIRVYYLRTSVDTINMLWPQTSLTQAPTVNQAYYAILNDTTAIIAPTPDNTYTAEITGIQRPTPLSSSNTTTYLTNVYADLFLAACMVFGSGYQQQFTQTAENPAMAMAWEDKYQKAKASAIAEEMRRRGLQPEA